MKNKILLALSIPAMLATSALSGFSGSQYTPAPTSKAKVSVKHTNKDGKKNWRYKQGESTTTFKISSASPTPTPSPSPTPTPSPSPRPTVAPTSGPTTAPLARGWKVIVKSGTCLINHTVRRAQCTVVYPNSLCYDPACRLKVNMRWGSNPGATVGQPRAGMYKILPIFRRGDGTIEYFSY